MKPTFLAGAVASMLPASSLAQSQPDIAAIRSEIAQIRQMQQDGAARIARLEAALLALDPPPVSTSQAHPVAVEQMAAAPQVTSQPSPLNISGDLRLRYEGNFGDRGVRNRERMALRGRLRASYAITEQLTVGAQLVTGDADDPNSSDQTLGGFGDDLGESLDQLWIRLRFGGLELTGGKIPLPFRSTDMVWDGDYSPQGVAARFSAALTPQSNGQLTALYSVVDEASAGPDSVMVGGQAALAIKDLGAFKVELAVGYYDYDLASTAGGDPGDFRSNRFAAGRYLSDFNLLDMIAAVEWNGLLPQWPAKLTFNYVNNLGAPDGLNQGFSLGASFGSKARRGDWRISYGYSSTDVDAVLAAFSEDNTVLASNAIQHSLSTDYVIGGGLLANAVVYRYRPKSAQFWHIGAPDDWRYRLRFNLLAEF